MVDKFQQDKKYMMLHLHLSKYPPDRINIQKTSIDPLNSQLSQKPVG
jgi:hypothetical protein